MLAEDRRKGGSWRRSYYMPTQADRSFTPGKSPYDLMKPARVLSLACHSQCDCHRHRAENPGVAADNLEGISPDP